MEAALQSGRDAFRHPGAKGSVTEEAWRRFFNEYLPKRYRVEKAFVVDHLGNCSEEIDIVIFDRHYSPFILKHGTGLYVPAESIYAAIEVKQTANVENLRYAACKISSVRKLKRTSAPITNMGRRIKPRKHFRIIGGLLTTECKWKSSFGSSFQKALASLKNDGSIDIGYCMDTGGFEFYKTRSKKGCLKPYTGDTSLVQFLLAFLERLQGLGTVPAIQFQAYLKAIS